MLNTIMGVIYLNKRKYKSKLNDETLLITDRDLINDVELATYIDARERYDRLHQEYAQHVEDDYNKKNQSENL